MKKTYYYIYILLCENDTYYTGYTVDLLRRYQAHCRGKCKYTRSFKPLAIAQSWRVEGTKSTAMQIECFIKRLKKPAKQRLIDFPAELSKHFPCCFPITTAGEIQA